MSAAFPAAARSAEADATWLVRVAGVSALLIGIGYVVIIPLYAAVGVPPDDGAAWLAYGPGKTTTWWAIVGLSVLTDALFVPVAAGLFVALQAVDRGAMVIGSALVGLFVVLDLAVTWPNYAALLQLSDAHAAATDSAGQASLVAAAEYATAVLSSKLEAVYSIVTLSAGILVIGLVMRRSAFGGVVAWLGIVTGVIGIMSVAASVFLGSLGITIILASAVTTIWVLLVGYRLLRMSRDPAPAAPMGSTGPG